MLALIMKSDIKGKQIWTGSACKWALLEYHSPDLPLSEWDETQSHEISVWQHFWQLNPACGGRPVNLKSKFGDIYYFQTLSDSFLIIFFPLHSLLILPQTNVSTLADLWLWSRGVICERLCRHHWLPIHVTVYRCVPGRQWAKRKTKKKEKKWGAEVESRGKDKRRMKDRRQKTRKGEERSGAERRGRGGNHSIVSAEGKRYEYSNFTLLIRDGCLFLWGTALLVFVSSLIICMMYSTALYSVMGERWRSGRLTMRPKGRRGRHSQLYSMQRSKANVSLPQISHHFTAAKAPFQQLYLLAQRLNKAILRGDHCFGTRVYH